MNGSYSLGGQSPETSDVVRAMFLARNNRPESGPFGFQSRRQTTQTLGRPTENIGGLASPPLVTASSSVSFPPVEIHSSQPASFVYLDEAIVGACHITRTGAVQVTRHREEVSAPQQAVSSRVVPYALLIRGMLDRDQIASARALLSLAIADQPDDPDLRKIARVIAPPRHVRSEIRDRDRSPEFHWLHANSGKYEGAWVALVGSELVASDASLKLLLSRLDALGLRGEALVHRVS